MPYYICKRCLGRFTQKGNFATHLRKKNICKVDLESGGVDKSQRELMKELFDSDGEETADVADTSDAVTTEPVPDTELELMLNTFMKMFEMTLHNKNKQI